MKFFNKAIPIFLIVSIALGSCSEEQIPSLPYDPRITARDSLLAIYGEQMNIKDPEYLEVYGQGVTELTYLNGKTEGKFWLGLFESPGKKICEYLVDLDPEASIKNFYQIILNDASDFFALLIRLEDR
ncbi:hypothetical protein [uncultured Algoriphagus sp.]|uniref:hypothetical protein n=1 Tax=uncultured Algoriphagus sp. TaxID=417365 RepID=UPI0030EE76EF|tara:strand:+ start:5145 stop:5528 length:384 start_codon:yes stop_codon:yes gene_type:complete